MGSETRCPFALSFKGCLILHHFASFTRRLRLPMRQVWGCFEAELGLFEAGMRLNEAPPLPASRAFRRVVCA